MSRSLTKRQLAQLETVITSNLGLHFPEERWPELRRLVAELAADFDFSGSSSFVDWLLTTPMTEERVARLAQRLTIGETYFFREFPSFQILQTQILPSLISARYRTRRELSFWCAGCASGEEAYSLAIAVRQALPNWRSWKIKILATDVNPAFLRRARQATYRDWSFRNTPASFRKKYFTVTGHNSFQLQPDIQKMVTFAPLNLVLDNYPSTLLRPEGMDVIFCRNVLMYFNRAQQTTVLAKLRDVLRTDGWLCLSVTESSLPDSTQFTAITYPDTTFFRKSAAPLPFDRFGGQHDLQPDAGRLSPIDDGSAQILEDQPLFSFAPEAAATTPADLPERTEPYEEALRLYELRQYAVVIDRLDGVETLEGRLLLARAYANLGHLEKAADSCKQAIDQNKLEPQAHYLQALILQEQGDVAKAIDALRRTLYLDPNCVLAHYFLGTLVSDQGAAMQGTKHLENALRLLQSYDADSDLPHSEGLSAGRLQATVQATLARRKYDDGQS